MTPHQQTIFETAVQNIAAAMGAQINSPRLYGPNNRPLMPDSYAYQRTAARRTGSMKNWVPKRLLTRTLEESERLTIVERSIDLVNNDPHAAGVADGFASTIVGSGLTPHPTLNPIALGLSKEQVRAIQESQRSAYQAWAPFADASGRQPFGSIQYLVQRNLIAFGEYLVLLHMIDEPALTIPRSVTNNGVMIA